ncbi:ligase, partial [Vibrio sp. 378]|nr:ligase [Vibrio sp. 378]
MESTNSSVPISNTVPLLAAIALALFFVPVKFAVGGVALAPSDIASLLSVGLIALIILEGRAKQL